MEIIPEGTYLNIVLHSIMRTFPKGLIFLQIVEKMGLKTFLGELIQFTKTFIYTGKHFLIGQ